MSRNSLVTGLRITRFTCVSLFFYARPQLSSEILTIYCIRHLLACYDNRYDYIIIIIKDNKFYVGILSQQCKDEGRMTMIKTNGKAV